MKSVIGILILVCLSIEASADDFYKEVNVRFNESFLPTIESDKKIVLSIIPGKIFSESTGTFIYEAYVNQDSTEINLSELGARCKFQIEKAMNYDAANNEVAKNPVNLLYGRVGAFYLEKNGDTEYLTSLKSKNDNSLMILYFDRPGRIVGRYESYGKKYDIDIKTINAGFVWVSANLTGKGVYRLQNTTQPVSVIFRSSKRQ